jgi:serpin B
LVVSPLSAYQILSLTTNGANGNTLQQMISALSSDALDRLNINNFKILKAFKNFTSIEIANAVMTAFNPERNFVDMSLAYDATVGPLINVDQVNKWCSEKTHGKISKILDNFPANTVMILLNAIYFKGLWKKEFNPKLTRKADFYNYGEKTSVVKVDMMYIKDNFRYYEDKNVQIIDIPFKKDSVSALILLPRENNINNFLADLDDEKINNYIKRMYFEEVELKLPKFELEFSAKLNTALKNLGMKDAFNMVKADFRRMKKENDIYIDQVLQKAYLKIDETGAEAAAVTSVIMVIKSSISFKREKRMVVDRPFIMMLRSNELPKDNDVLFTAKIEKL